MDIEKKLWPVTKKIENDVMSVICDVIVIFPI